MPRVRSLSSITVAIEIVEDSIRRNAASAPVAHRQRALKMLGKMKKDLRVFCLNASSGDVFDPIPPAPTTPKARPKR